MKSDVTEDISFATRYLRIIIEGMKIIGISPRVTEDICLAVETFKGNILRRLEETELHVAIGGETTSGKTTLLNSLSSLNNEEVSIDAHWNADNLFKPCESIFTKTLGQRLRLVADYAAKEAAATSWLTLEMSSNLISHYQGEVEVLEKSVPHDLKIVESKIAETLKDYLYNNISDYIKIMTKHLENTINLSNLEFDNWSKALNKEEIYNNYAHEAEKQIIKIIHEVERLRRDELSRLSDSLAKELVRMLQALYSSLPFKAQFDSKSIHNLLKFKTLEYVSIRNKFNAIEKAPSTGDPLAGRVIGNPLLEPVGDGLGRWIGGKVFDKSLAKIRKEVLDVFSQRTADIKQNIAEAIQIEMSNENTAVIIPQFNNVISNHVEQFYQVVQDKIMEQYQQIEAVHQELNGLKTVAAIINEDSEALSQWCVQTRWTKEFLVTEQTIRDIKEILRLVKEPPGVQLEKNGIKEKSVEYLPESSSANHQVDNVVKSDTNPYINHKSKENGSISKSKVAVALILILTIAGGALYYTRFTRACSLLQVAQKNLDRGTPERLSVARTDLNEVNSMLWLNPLAGLEKPLASIARGVLQKEEQAQQTRESVNTENGLSNDQIVLLLNNAGKQFVNVWFSGPINGESYFALPNEFNSPQKLENFYDKYWTQNAILKLISVDKYIQGIYCGPIGNAEVPDVINILNKQVSGNQLKVSVTIQYSDGPAPGEYTLVSQDGVWKINYAPWFTALP